MIYFYTIFRIALFPRLSELLFLKKSTKTIFAFFDIFDVEKTALIIGAILSISRIVRVISNIAFNKIHSKYKEKVGVILPILLCISIILMILGSFIGNSVILKLSIMSLGYIIILFIRDPFKVYMQDLALRNVGKEYDDLTSQIKLCDGIIFQGGAE